ncbi:serine hydrolase domain-containing protein [Flavobacterium orientale]|uniref:Penicillin-binding protein 4 n=1 Tax=Flavobacterium orientale TaxID=1756020 RepID=A0A916Y4C7_9FLAO|nr:serine hydrolase domain-containing protein [Flavobacterium orientale]GGD30761.1 penicillin-binding protein 4* [Flavobacterium orientale]
MKRILIIGLGMFFSALSFGQTAQTNTLDSLFTALYNKNAFNGNVLIADKGNVIFKKSYGLADEASKRKLNETTIFELASVSKQFTAMGILLLEKQGKLSYDDKISKYLPELAFYEGITIRNLVHHTGGLPDYMELFDEKWDKTKFVVNQDIVNEFAKHKPAIRFKPNEKFEYSNTGYAFLGLIVEKVAKKSFEAYLQENIFKPLKMNNTFVYRSRYKPMKVENYANGYVLDSLGNKVLPDSFGKKFYSYYLDGIVGDGMVNSTISDLLVWDRALYNEQFISKKGRDLLYQSTKTTDGKETNYGFGWFITDDAKYGKIVSHSGGWAGYSTFIERHLTNDKTIIVLQNNSLPTTRFPTKEIRMVVYNEPLLAEKKIQLQSEDLDNYLGVYGNENFPLKITISKKDNTLYAQATGQGEIPLDAYENDTFKFDPADITMVFNVKENTFELNQRGMKIVLKRE